MYVRLVVINEKTITKRMIDALNSFCSIMRHMNYYPRQCIKGTLIMNLSTVVVL